MQAAASLDLAFRPHFEQPRHAIPLGAPIEAPFEWVEVQDPVHTPWLLRLLLIRSGETAAVEKPCSGGAAVIAQDELVLPSIEAVRTARKVEHLRVGEEKGARRR